MIFSRYRSLLTSGYFWVFVTAFVLRAGYLFEAFRGNELIAHPLIDAAVYFAWARDILAGKWLWYEAMHYTPAIPLWVAGWTALTGWSPAVHFTAFHLLGAVQAVLIGKTAEMLWSRRVGIVTAVVAATYWPLIVFEASYYAEAFAIWNFAVAIYLAVRWWHKSRGGSSRLENSSFEETGERRTSAVGTGVLWWAGFHMGLSVLARANAILCLPVFGLCIFVVAIKSLQRSRWQAALLAVAFCLPSAMLCAPVMFWNWKLTGIPMLRTGGWMSVNLGNEPNYRGLVVPAGERWMNYIYLPIRAGQISDSDQEKFWRDEVIHILKERRSEWIQLMARKAILQTNRFEVSQEIDVYRFRAASSLLSLPVWPGWGTVAPLAILAGLAMLGKSDARRGLPLLLGAAIYFASMMPVQACARYRLPTVVPLLPLVGWALVFLWETIQQRRWKHLSLAVIPVLVSGVLIWPDWLHMRNEPIINHDFLVGLKRYEHGDHQGAYQSFEAGLKWNPSDPDCPLRMAGVKMETNEIEQAEALYRQALVNLPGNYNAILGLGECALAKGRPEEALPRAREAMLIAPNNTTALQLASRTCAALHEWSAMAILCQRLADYPVHDSSTDFTQAWAWIRAEDPNRALQAYQNIATNMRFTSLDRDRALYLAAALIWRADAKASQPIRIWENLAARDEGLFSALATQLLDRDPKAVEKIAVADQGRSRQYVDYTLGLHAWKNGSLDEARRYFQAVVSARNAREMLITKQDVLEIWALEDLEKLKAQ